MVNSLPRKSLAIPKAPSRFGSNGLPEYNAVFGKTPSKFSTTTYVPESRNGHGFGRFLIWLLVVIILSLGILYGLVKAGVMTQEPFRSWIITLEKSI